MNRKIQSRIGIVFLCGVVVFSFGLTAGAAEVKEAKLANEMSLIFAVMFALGAGEGEAPLAVEVYARTVTVDPGKSAVQEVALEILSAPGKTNPG